MFYLKFFKWYKYEFFKLIVVLIKLVVDYWLINDLEIGWEYWIKDRVYVKFFKLVIFIVLERVYGLEMVFYERVYMWIKKFIEFVKM